MADRGDNRAQRSDRLPVLSFLSRPGPDTSTGTGGFLSAVIAGSLILVLALMGLTIAIGRAPVETVADQTDQVAHATPAAPTSYASPEPTGPRYTPEPIINGVPQKPPSYEPAPSASTAPAGSAAQGDRGQGDRAGADSAESAANDRLQDLQERIEEGLGVNLPSGWLRNDG